MMFKAESQPMSEMQTKLLLACLLSEMEGKEIETDDFPILAQIVKKRIEVCELPIKLTSNALVSVTAFCSSPSEAIVLLIDALNTFSKNEIITVHKLSEQLYPFGFYTEKSFEDYIDNYIKLGKVKWSEIY